MKRSIGKEVLRIDTIPLRRASQRPEGLLHQQPFAMMVAALELDLKRLT